MNLQQAKNQVLFYGVANNIVIMKSSNNDDLFMIDLEDFERIKNHTWGSVRGHMKATIKQQNVYLHRLLKGTVGDKYVDHINTKRWDNRKINLRECTNSENQCNRYVAVNNKIGYKGVCHCGEIKPKPYRAQINFRENGAKHKISKMFATAEEAARQYDEWALRYHGEFARINNI
jgi:hypothetical protein